ncbi:hypothetical protein K458DRAFT_414505 [Lentithecium fluviatile CBS 122367]|uniref:Uncharacterized protein n=1 Tax=Lentithecium fluviatile CBS 122367 TaxID=1168545 RepID=A0A6G1JEZ4_9PLEO|nr:hypothetical protein K458DRAFT_414505 [Lentithecium fluviatile CBS 122367]
MKLPTASILFLGSVVRSSAHPHPNTQTQQTPSSTTVDFALLDKPMHTTALMAGDAWRLTMEANAAARTRSEAREQLEL